MTSEETPFETHCGGAHSLILHPRTLDALICRYCRHEEPLPRGAPRRLAERFEWARVLGLLEGAGGRSVAFCAALGSIG